VTNEYVTARRLSPLSFVVGAVREATALLAAGAAGLAVGGVSTAVYFALIGLALGLAHHVVRWATFTYRLYDDRIEMRKELIGRSVKNIPLERIRGVDINAGPAHRLLGLAVVHIDAAAGGGGADEAVLNAVTRDEAARVRRVLLDRLDRLDRRDVRAEAGDTAAAGAGTAVPAAHDAIAGELVRARPRWYLYAPLSGAYLLTPFALIGSLLGALYNIGDDFGLITERRVEALGRQVSGLPLPLVVALVIFLVLAMPVASVVVFALFNWDFTLTSRAGSIVAERGLLTRRSVTLERRRIRGVELLDNPLERLAGVVRLRALVTGLGDAAHRGTLLPTSPRPVATDAAGGVFGTFASPLIRHPAAARNRRIVRAAFPGLAAAAIAGLAGQLWAVALCLVLAVLGVPLGLDRYEQLGHATDDLRLAVRSGSLRRRQVIVERGAVVGWRVRQTLFQRRLGLTTLVAAVGAGDGEVAAVDMAEPDAAVVARRITPNWVTPFLEQPSPEQSSRDHASPEQVSAEQRSLEQQGRQKLERPVTRGDGNRT
jgi:putative membrane protein